MKGTFGAGIDDIKKQVGTGHLVGKLIVDQIYAKYQHEGADFFHPDGGKPFYLRDPLFAHAFQYMQKLGSSAITDYGSDFVHTMADCMEDLNKEVIVQAPKEFLDLQDSGHPIVVDNGHVTYDRAPVVGRLSEEELRVKARVAHLLWPNRYVRGE